MKYHISRIVDAPFEEVKKRTIESLKDQGFGIITEIDLQKTFANKLGKDVAPYHILGACNPHYAYEAIGIEERIGTMLPCNVILRQLDESQTEISAVDPVKSMEAVDNKHLKELAGGVKELLEKAVANA